MKPKFGRRALLKALPYEQIQSIRAVLSSPAWAPAR